MGIVFQKLVGFPLDNIRVAPDCPRRAQKDEFVKWEVVKWDARTNHLTARIAARAAPAGGFFKPSPRLYPVITCRVNNAGERGAADRTSDGDIECSLYRAARCEASGALYASVQPSVPEAGAIMAFHRIQPCIPLICNYIFPSLPIGACDAIKADAPRTKGLQLQLQA